MTKMAVRQQALSILSRLAIQRCAIGVRNERGKQDVRIKDDPHEIALKTSSFVRAALPETTVLI